jgi:MYXO-CTERM domain-containing protein
MKCRVGCVVLALGVFSAISLVPGRARACSCMKVPSPKEAAEKAKLVFEGTAVGMTAEKDRATKLVHHLYEFEVVRTFKGEGAERVVIRTADNSAACGRIYEIGEAYLVYAREAEGKLVDNLCSRTRRIAVAKEDLMAFGAIEPEPEPEPAAEPEPEPPRVEPTEADEQPPPAPSKRGCHIDVTPGAWALLLLVAALPLRRRRAGYYG